MKYIELALVLAAATSCSEGVTTKAVANIRQSDLVTVPSECGPVSGTIRFEQIDNSDQVTVEIDVTGIAAGSHGFHIHEFGDETMGGRRLGLHYVKQCFNSSDPECMKDSIHGLPPNEIRQTGDMGNIVADENCNIKRTVVIGQDKLSLTDPIKSIVGRAVNIHSDEDDGTAPFGNAGVSYAFGIIGVATDGLSMGPTLPFPTEIVCRMIPSAQYPVNGTVGILYEYGAQNSIQMRGILDSLPKNQKMSFHFHEFAEAGNPGAIYNQQESGVQLTELTSDANGYADYTNIYNEPSGQLAFLLGKALTVHEGPESSTPTIGFSVCGLANAGTLEFLLPRTKNTNNDGNSSNATTASLVLSLLTLIFGLAPR